MSVLLVDNYDSFTHNLAQLLGVAGADVHVVRNDAIDLGGVRALAPTHIVLSPGPGNPTNERDFGICRVLIEELAPTTPLLGVCLGHQGLAACLGAEVVRAPAVVHGKTSWVEHDGTGIFTGLPREIEVMRYHSLLIDEASLPPAFRVTSRTVDDGLIMGIAHRQWPAQGVQFHPESIGTPDGLAMMQSFLAGEGAA